MGKSQYAVRTLTCVGCSETVTGRIRPTSSYCSLECYRGGKRPQRKTGEDRVCKFCGTGFYVPKSRVDRGQGDFCTIQCHNDNQGRGKTAHVCKMCGGSFRWSPSRTASGKYKVTYCTIACRDADPLRRELLMGMNERQQLKKMTRAEAAGYAVLDSLGVPYERQAQFNGKFTPDATVTAARLVVQFDGDYWHDRKGTSTEARIQRRVALDKSQDAYLRACGWSVVRLWESDLLRDPDACRETVRLHYAAALS